MKYFTQKYKNSENYQQIHSKDSLPVKIDKFANTVPWIRQFILLFNREFMKVIKSPFDLRVQLAQIIIFAIICIIVYHDVKLYIR